MRRTILTLSGLFVTALFACATEDEFVGNPSPGPANEAGTTDGGGLDGTTSGDGAVGIDASQLQDGATNDGAAVDAGACLPQATVPALKIVDVTTATASSALYAMQPPGSNDWYLVEQGGRVRIVRNGAILATPFLDISAAFGDNLGERGLLSIAFHPNYAQNGRFFLMGTPGDNANGTFSPINADAVVEFKRNDANPDIADVAKVRDIVVLPTSDTNHNGGTIVFGPGNFLYVATGDGGGGCESSKPGQVQDTTKLFGKVLRLNVDVAAPFAAAGNPFTDDSRVYHYGLRNPFRFNFDPVTGDLFIGDVGQDKYEEISVIPGNAPGKNLGWPAFEGAVGGTCGSDPLAGPSPHTPPIVSIDRQGATPFAGYKSTIGGQVYRGTAIPALRGIYLFADFYAGVMGALRYCNGTTYGPTAVQLSTIATSNGGTLSNISSFVQGNDGELYVTYGFGSRLGKFVLK